MTGIFVVGIAFLAAMAVFCALAFVGIGRRREAGATHRPPMTFLDLFGSTAARIATAAGFVVSLLLGAFWIWFFHGPG